MKFETSSGYLKAFYSGNINEAKIREYLQKKLPNFFIPAVIVKLHDIPITRHGKIDRNLLLSLHTEDKPQVVKKPNTWLEEEILNIWANIIKKNKDEIGTELGFFEIGGNSLNVIELTSKLNVRFNFGLKYRDIITASNVMGLKKLFLGKSKKENEIIYLLAGSKNRVKQDIILFPPYTGESLYYIDFARRLSSHFNVYSCDYPFSSDGNPLNLDDFVKKISSEIQNKNIENPILGGASYGFRTAYRLSFYLNFNVKLILNFDGSVYDSSEHEFNTIVDINTFEIEHHQIENKEKREIDLIEFKNKPFKSKFIEDWYIGKLKQVKIFNFYPKLSAVSYFSRNDITDGEERKFEIDGDHESMLKLNSNHFKISKIISDEIL